MNKPKRNKKRWQKEELGFLRKKFLSDNELNAIAVRIGRSVSAVKQKYRQLQSSKKASIAEKTDALIGSQVFAEFISPEYENVLVSPYVLRRTDYGSKRYYYMFDEMGNPMFAVSCTTFLGDTAPMPEPLLKWYCDMGYEEAKAYAQERADFGTLMHDLFNRHLRAIFLGNTTSTSFEYDDLNEVYQVVFDTIDMMPVTWLKEMQKALAGFIVFCNDYDVEPIAIEIPLVGKLGEDENGEGGHWTAGFKDAIVKMLPEKAQPLNEIGYTEAKYKYVKKLYKKDWTIAYKAKGLSKNQAEEQYTYEMWKEEVINDSEYSDYERWFLHERAKRKESKIIAGIDYKSGKIAGKPDYIRQLVVYAQLLTQTFPIKLDALYNYAPKDWRMSEFPQIGYTLSKNYLERDDILEIKKEVALRLSLYYAKNPSVNTKQVFLAGNYDGMDIMNNYNYRDLLREIMSGHVSAEERAMSVFKSLTDSDGKQEQQQPEFIKAE